MITVLTAQATNITCQYFDKISNPMYDKSGKPAERKTWLIKSDTGGEGALLDSFIDFLLYKHNAGEWPRGER